MATTSQSKVKHLLIVGPLPPPIGGSPLSVQEMLNELNNRPNIRTGVINTSPARDPREKLEGFHPEKVRRMVNIFSQFIREIRNYDAAIVFANNLFALTMVPFLTLWAKGSHKRIYIKPVGGDLDIYLEGLWKPFRDYLLRCLRSTDGVLAQTYLLKDSLVRMGCANVHYLSGYRSVIPTIPHPKSNPQELRLIYLAHITREKGALTLLEALQVVPEKCLVKITCDFFGPIHAEIREEFLRQMQITSEARYCGTAPAGSGSQLIVNYDALVVPTYFACEGHPGVIIEAMHAGVPVISTEFRAIPELVSQGENGLLVPVGDSRALADAIITLAINVQLREQMGWANYLRGQEYRTDVVISQLLKIIYPDYADAAVTNVSAIPIRDGTFMTEFGIHKDKE